MDIGHGGPDEPAWETQALRWVVESLRAAFFVTDRAGRYVFFNTAAIASMNRPLAELLAGKVQGVLTLCPDITALRDAERELANSQRRFETLIEILPAGVGHVAADGTVVLANREARRILADNDITGRHIETWDGRVFEADGSPCPVTDFPAVRCMAERKPQPQRLLGIQRADGTMAWALHSATPLFDGDRVVGALVVFLDVAARKLAEDRAEHARALSEQIFRILADQSSDAIFRTDASGNCTYVNARGLDLAGMTLADALGTGWSSAVHPTDRALVIADLERAIARREHWRGLEYRVVDPQGRVTWMRGSASPIVDADGSLHGYIGINNDITALRQAEQRESMMIEELNHRVKNAMATVVALASATARNSQTVAEFMATFTGRIQSMARLHEALARGHWIDLSLAQIFDNALGGVLQVAGPQVTISARVAMPLGQALFELFANAVRHGSLARPGGLLDVHWHLTDDDRVCIHWTETNGHPITEQPRPGVGLTILRGLIEQEIGGTLDLRFEATGLHARLVFPS